MQKSKFLDMISGNFDDRLEMTETIAALIISASPDLSDDDTEVDREFTTIMNALLDADNSVLIRKAYEVNLIED